MNVWQWHILIALLPAYFNLLTHFAKEFKLFGTWWTLLNKNVWPLLHLRGPADIYFFGEVESHHPHTCQSFKYFINSCTYKNENSIPLHNCSKPLPCFILLVSCGNVVQFWVEASNMAPDAHMLNILKGTRLVDAELACSKWTNQQRCTVWSLVFAFSQPPFQLPPFFSPPPHPQGCYRYCMLSNNHENMLLTRYC